MDPAGGFEEEVAERRDAVDVEVGPRDRDVDVEHQHRLLVDLGGVLVGPLGRADQAIFLGVPARVDDGPLRLPPLLDGRPERPAHLQGRRRAAPGVDRAVDPGVAVVADHDPAVGLDLPLELGDHVPDRPDLVVHLDRHADLHRPRADVVRDRQAPLPAGGDVGPAHRFEDRPGRLVADRQRRDRGVVVLADLAGGLLPLLDGSGEATRMPAHWRWRRDGEPILRVDRQPGRVLERRAVGGRGVARPEREELDAPALERRRARYGPPGKVSPLP